MVTVILSIYMADMIVVDHDIIHHRQSRATIIETVRVGSATLSDLGGAARCRVQVQAFSLQCFIFVAEKPLIFTHH